MPKILTRIVNIFSTYVCFPRAWTRRLDFGKSSYVARHSNVEINQPFLKGIHRQCQFVHAPTFFLPIRSGLWQALLTLSRIPRNHPILKT